MIDHPKWLTIAYILNLLILVPVVFQLFSGSGMATIFEGKVAESTGLRILVGSLWLAILLASVGGLFQPAFFAPVILIQIFYKATWLLLYVLPLIKSGAPYPVGISACFLFIVVTYPLLFLLATGWLQKS